MYYSIFHWSLDVHGMHVYLICFLLFIALKEDSMAFGNPTKLVFVLKLDLKLTFDFWRIAHFFQLRTFCRSVSTSWNALPFLSSVCYSLMAFMQQLKMWYFQVAFTPVTSSLRFWPYAMHIWGLFMKYSTNPLIIINVIIIYSFTYLMSGEVLAWLSVWSKVQMKWYAYGPADATASPSSLAPMKSRTAYLGCLGKKAIKWM